MIQVNLKEAEAHLAELIEEAAAGREVVITGTAGFVVRLMPIAKRNHEAQPWATLYNSGTWTAEQEADLLHAVAFFEEVEEAA